MEALDKVLLHCIIYLVTIFIICYDLLKKYFDVLSVSLLSA